MDNERLPETDTTEPVSPVLPNEVVGPDTAPERSGPSWERRGETTAFKAFFETVGDVLLRPKETFRAMRVTGGIGASFAFYLITGVPAIILQALFQGVMNATMSAILAVPIPPTSLLNQFLLGLPALAVVPFLIAGLYHLMLAIVGGSKHGFGATFRVVAYESGSVALFQWVPCVGALVAIFWGFYIAIVGLQHIHETTGARAFFSVLLSVVFLVIIVIVVMIVLMTTGVLRDLMPGFQPQEV